ncbi:NAD(P)-dependent alcohol dehydrogenase, partial [bacterium]
MKQFQLSPGNDFSRLQLVEVETPQPKYGEVLIKMGAASLNYRDLIIAENPKTEAGRVPLSDGAGEITAIGEGVTKWKVGDRVAPNFFRDWVDGRFQARYHDAALGGSVGGALSEYYVTPENSVVRIPDAYT